MKAITFPKVIPSGSCSVTIYDTPTKGYPGYTLVYYQNGKRKRETSADYDVLRARADEVLEDLNEGRSDPTALKNSQRTEYAASCEAAKPTGLPLLTLTTHAAEAIKILGSDLLIVAARDYKRRRLDKVQDRLVADAVKDMLEEKERQKKSKRHQETLKSHLNRFAGYSLSNIASVTADEINQFLDGLKDKDNKPVSARTRDNYANSITSLFEWAKSKRYVPDDYDEAKRITRLSSDEDGSITIYTPDEMQALLSAATDKLSKLVPFLAIGGFAGLRSSEIMRLDWSDVRMENGDPCVVVQKGKVKRRGKSRRIVPMSENLKAWLKPHAQKSGLIWPQHHQYLYELLGELAPKAEALLREKAPKAKLEWKSNALRHSCISYRVAKIKNVPQVALESGNSPQMIDSNYRELVTDADAERWFAILPAEG